MPITKLLAVSGLDPFRTARPEMWSAGERT